jgi:hypothetical protein
MSNGLSINILYQISIELSKMPYFTGYLELFYIRFFLKKRMDLIRE